MEGFGGLGVSDGSSAVKKKRSNTSRRPQNDSQPPLDYRDISSLSDVSKGSSEEDIGYGSVTRKKEMHVNLCSSRASFSNNAESQSAKNETKNEDGGFVDSDEASNNGSFRGSNEQKHSGIDSKRSSKVVLAPANLTSTTNVGHSHDLNGENRVKKVKLKVGGVTKTIRAKSISDGASAVGSLMTKSSRILDAACPRQKLKQDPDESRSFASDKRNNLQGNAWNDSKKFFDVGKANSLGHDENLCSEDAEKYEPVRKSKRVSRKRLIDEAVDDEDDDNIEIRYLEKLRTSRVASDYGVEYKNNKERVNRKQRKTSNLSNWNSEHHNDLECGLSRSQKQTKKSRSGRVSDDTDCVEDEETISDNEPSSKKKKLREFVDSVVDHKNELTVTTRHRALQTGRDVSSSLGASLIEFPNGLPFAPPRKQKEKLSEVEQQLKKAEAAERRRMQVEKAARESEAEAIRKTLGQDSSRKKREDKIKKRKEDLAQEKTENAMILASDSVRWVMGPSGTIITFPNEMGLPTIFDSKPCSYPPPRERCAGPSCPNPYKYRDSESKLPLCSLQCYKAIHQKTRPLTAC